MIPQGWMYIKYNVYSKPLWNNNKTFNSKIIEHNYLTQIIFYEQIQFEANQEASKFEQDSSLKSVEPNRLLDSLVV